MRDPVDAILHGTVVALVLGAVLLDIIDKCTGLLAGILSISGKVQTLLFGLPELISVPTHGWGVYDLGGV